MKKRIIATLIGTLILFNCFAGDMISFAENSQEIVAEEESQEEVIEDAENEAEVEEADVEDASEISESEEENNEEISNQEESGEAESDYKIEVTDGENASFEQSKTFGKTVISMNAAAGVFPEGAYFEAKEITDNNDITSIENAVEDKLAASKEVVKVKAFDITVFNKDGDEIQPNTECGNVNVSFNNVDTKSADEVKVFHVEDSLANVDQVASSVASDSVSFEAEHFSLYAITYVDDNGADQSIKDIVDVTVTDSQGNAVSSNSTISEKNVTFKVVYDFKQFQVDTNENPDLPRLNSGVVYSLPDIENISEFNLTETKTARLKDKDLGELGELVITPVGDKATVTLKITNTEAFFVKSASATVELSLEVTANKTATRTVLFPDGNSYTFTIDEFAEKAPTMTFAGAEDKSAENTAKWTATITNNDKNPKAYADGYTFKVTLGDGEEYVDGSFEVDGSPVSATINGKELSYTIESPKTGASDTTTITYKTKKGAFKVDQDTISKNLTSLEDTLNDKPALVDASNNEEIAKGNDSVKFTKTLVKWLDKSEGKVNTDGTINWEIKVRNNGYDLENVTLYDLFGGDGANMTLVTSSVKIDNVDVDPKKITTSNGTDYSWTTVLGDMSSEKTEYVITYQTQITDYTKYLKENHSSQPSNKAWVTYKYFGFGNGTFTGPDVEKTATVNLKAGIEINASNYTTGRAYDPATHRLKWKIAVNQEYQVLNNVTVKDLIPTGQKYVEGSISTITYTTKGGSTRTETISPDSDMLISLGNLASEKVEFTLETELTDAEVAAWTDNKAGSEFTNKVMLEYKDITNPQYDTTKITYASTVLKTSIENYNYNDHTVDVIVVVDSNAMDMKNTVLTNQLKYGDYNYAVDGDVFVNGEKVETSLDSDGNLVVDLGNISKGDAKPTKTITFKAKVTSDKYKTVNNGTFNIANKAVLVTDDIKKLSAKSVSKTASPITIKNSVLIKSGRASQETGEANYTVYINKAKSELPTGTVVTDVLGSSLELDATSIVLSKCELNAAGEIASETVVNADKTITRGADGKTTLEIKLPAGTDTYKLTYSAMLSDTKLTDTKNNIAMSMSTESVSYAAVNAYVGFTAGAEFTKAAYIDITAKDKEGHVLDGVKYSIQDDAGKEYLQVTTDENGKISIRTGKLTAGNTYKIVPVTTPKGYNSVDELPTAEIKLGKANGQTVDNEKSIDFVYDKKTTSLDVSTHVDYEDGKLISGPTIKVTKDGNDLTSWTTSTGKLENLVWGHKYVITNTDAPNEYKKDDNTFVLDVTLDNDGNVVVIDKDKNPVTEVKVVVATKKTANLVIDNVSSSKNKPITGNKIVISTTETPTPESTITTIETDGSTKEVNLPEGAYYIVDIDAPVGFEKAPTTQITVNEDGTITNDTTGDPITEDGLTIANDHNDEKYTVTYNYETLGLDPAMFKEMKFAVFTLDRLSGTLLKLYPREYDEETGEAIYNLDYQDEYIFMPENNLEGYDLVEPITIMPMGEKNSEGITESKLMAKPMNAPTFTETTVEDLGKKVQPHLTPVPVVETPVAQTEESDDSNNSHQPSGSYASAPATAAEELKDNDIVAAAELNADAAAGTRLAKTGGFIGTLTGYLAAITMILVGIYLVFGKRKRA